MMRIALFCLGLLLLSGCGSRTIYVPVESVRTEREWVDRWSRDSIFLHDSVYVERKGDTLISEKVRIFYKERLVRDSVYVTDSVSIEIPYPVIEVKEVNRLQKWQMVLMCLGGVLVGMVGFRLLRWLR